MRQDWLAALMLAVLAAGSFWWAWREFRTARIGAQRHRRVALYYALILDSFGTAFAIMALGRMWPGLPPLLPFIGLAPAFLAALGVRFHKRFAGWILARIA